MTTSSKRKDAEAEVQYEGAEDENEEEDVEQQDVSAEDQDEVMEEAPSDTEREQEPEPSEVPSRKRKRAVADDLEESYMRRLAKEEQKAEEKRHEEKAKQETEEDGEGGSSESEKDEDEPTSEGEEDKSMPVHESQTGGDPESREIEKSNRTVFLGNVSSKTIKSHSAKRTLTRHLESFLSTLPESTVPHKVDSIRFRSTAFAGGAKIPKRASFARREVMDETTPSTNAYVVYSTIQAARKAPTALNGTVVLDRHLRVDSIAHPSPADHKRCVFVGNLDFVDQTTDPDEQAKQKKNSQPADVEEGLWRTFNQHTGKSRADKNTRGNVESVRVIRDAATRVGKGFAYVQFYDQNCVEEAILLDGKKFPPFLPRKLRIARAKRVSKRRDERPNDRESSLGGARKTLQGRAGQLLGKAGQAQMKAKDKGSVAQNSLVFEGQRATEGSRIKVKTKSRGSKAKKNSRSSQRAAVYKAAGGKKSK